MNPIFWTIAFIGHLGFWCIVYNRTHATRWKRRTRKRCERITVAMVVLIFAWIIFRAINGWTSDFWAVADSGILERIYLLGSIAMGAFFTARWSWRKFKPNPKSLVSQKRSLIDVQKEIGNNLYRTPLGLALKKVPFNQSHLIAVEEITLAIKNLPPELNGIKICHMSDFHFTGQIDRSYFERIVSEANNFKPDLVVITGDLIDEFSCLDWIEPVFGKLVSKHGTFFVRGNHDIRIGDQEQLFKRTDSAQMKWIGGQCIELSINGVQVSLCGNELPWFPGAENLNPASMPSDSFKILLTHTPDQIDWARENNFQFDLIFAGHNHGGQIAIPVVGPIVAPSKYGVLYASGTFEIDDAVMHVSRGISGDECIRINCPPEIGCFTLRRG